MGDVEQGEGTETKHKCMGRKLLKLGLADAEEAKLRWNRVKRCRGTARQSTGKQNKAGRV